MARQGRHSSPQADVPLAQNSAIPLAEDVLYLRGSSHCLRRKVCALYRDNSEFREVQGCGATCGFGVLLPRGHNEIGG
jgi:hypothetical protein